MKQNHVWVVEVKLGKSWLPCDGGHLLRRDALANMVAVWRANNPNDKFRIAKYVAAINAARATSIPSRGIP